MREVSDLFEACASSLWGTMTSHSGTAGFRVPDYQRSYDWSEEKITRLLEDCANGFYYLTQSDESFTFLGTLILVKERSKEPSFDGTSLAVVDGQQRITTLILVSCALIEVISEHISDAEHLPEFVQKWIKQETEFQLNELFKCTIGQMQGRGRLYKYPKIVRDEDHRAKHGHEYEYYSYVSRFLMAFAEFYQNQEKAFRIPSARDEDASEQRFVNNYRFIRNQILSLLSPQEVDSSLDTEVLQSQDFQKRGIQQLFEKLDVFPDQSKKNQALSEISKGCIADGLVRLVLFSSYINNCVVLTRVETDDESSAFDIFDALNTTGEPLTAIETFKPRVIQFEKAVGRFKGSSSEQAFSDIENNINGRFENTDSRQRETKEVLVTFALYIDGTKESKELNSQRRYLRSRFEKIESKENKQTFVQNFRDIAEFRAKYWHKDGIYSLPYYHSHGTAEELQLCFQFISDMNTSLALPIAARFWSHYKRTGNEEEFLNAVRALTAFIIFRRSVTGGTKGIDTDFRSMMSKSSEEGDALCAGLHFNNEILGIASFKKLLRSYLSAQKIGVTDKSNWINQVREVPLAQHSKSLVRYLIMAGAHHAIPDHERPGKLTREGVRPTDEREYLAYANWISDLYKTVEHVAPESNPGNGWDEDIYKRPVTRHTIGNLTLLPQEENSVAGNSGWPRKRVFYLALMETNKAKQEEWFQEAKTNGFDFPRKTQQLLKRGHRLHLLDSLSGIEDWNEKFIYERGDNILSLAWDKISPWLFE